jgi:hypothetical protein
MSKEILPENVQYYTPKEVICYVNFELESKTGSDIDIVRSNQDIIEESKFNSDSNAFDKREFFFSVNQYYEAMMELLYFYSRFNYLLLKYVTCLTEEEISFRYSKTKVKENSKIKSIPNDGQNKCCTIQ